MSSTLAHGTVSSGGSTTTTSANQEYLFTDNFLNSVYIKAGASDITVKFNSESVEHVILAGDALSINNFQVKKFTVVENGVDFLYHGTYI